MSGDRTELLQSTASQLRAMENSLAQSQDAYIYDIGWVARYEEIHRRLEPILRRAPDHKVPRSFIENFVFDGERHRRIGRISFLHLVEGLRGYVEYVLDDDRSNNVPRVLREWRQRDASFVASSGLRTILELNLQELSTLNPEESPKAVAVMCGAIAEGFLINALCDVNQLPGCIASPAVLATVGARTHGLSSTSDLTDIKWSLAVLIEVANELQLISKNTASLLGPVIKSFRNLIHPAVELREGYKVRNHEAEGALALLGALLADLAPPAPAP